MNFNSTVKGSDLEGFYPAGWDFDKIDACIDAPEKVTERQAFWNKDFTPVQCDSLGEFEISKGILKPNYDCWIIDSLHDRKIIDFEITGFSEEYEINPSTGETRPAGGDYYREILFKLDNGKILTIVAQDSLSDGYMDIFIK